MSVHAIDLFAGPGGWDVGARLLGLVTIGIEFDEAACKTRRAAGLPTVENDVLNVDPSIVASLPGLIASPPCQTFSTAGKGAGRAALEEVLLAVKRLGADPHADPFDGLDVEDVRTKLVVEPLRWALLNRHTWLAWEQVPTVLPVWEACADVLRDHGWNVVTGNVNAEQYGVPQTRKRAVLLAHREREVSLPTPTHSRYHSRSPHKLDEGVLPWVSMAQALRWDDNELVGFARRSDGRDEVMIDGEAYRARDLREASMPAQVVTEKARSWDRYDYVRQSGRRGAAQDRPTDAPAPTVTGKGTMTGHREAFTDEGQERTYVADVADDKPWTRERPATTIATRDLVPGANANRFNGATKSRNDGVRVTPEQAAALQTFPADYPWQGTKTKVFQQIGNAIPPMLAAALLAEVAL